MRLFTRRKRSESMLCVELDDRRREMLDYYLKTVGGVTWEKAVMDLLEKGYRYWLLERNYGEESVRDKVNWDPVYWSMKLASGFAFYKIRLRDAIEELKKLTMSLSGVLGDLKLCYEHPEAVRKNPDFIRKIEEYQREVNAYVEKFITALREDLDSADKYVDDEEKFLDELEELINQYRSLLKERKEKK